MSAKVFSLADILPVSTWERRPPEDWRTEHLMRLLRDVVYKDYWPCEPPEYTDEPFPLYPTHRELRARITCRPLQFD